MEMTGSGYKYDACLSFAGEQRGYVEEVAGLLKNAGVRVFYDLYEQVDLWGKDLYSHLDEVYRKDAKFCIIFVSADYASKIWTNHERRIAQARALLENREYVLPVRFDDTEIPGVLPTVGYIDTRVTGLGQLVDLIVSKVATFDGTNRQYIGAHRGAVIAAVPRTLEEQRILVELKPVGWEYLLFAGVLAQGKITLEPKLRDHQIRFAPEIRRILHNTEAMAYLEESMRSFESIIENMMKVLEPRAQEWALGEPGVSGIPENIIHLGQRFIRAYEDMLDWASDLRGTVTSARLNRAFELGARYVDMPIKQVGEFIDRNVKELAHALDRVSKGEEGIEIELILKLSIGEKVTREFKREIKRAPRR